MKLSRPPIFRFFCKILPIWSSVLWINFQENWDDLFYTDFVEVLITVPESVSVIEYPVPLVTQAVT